MRVWAAAVLLLSLSACSPPGPTCTEIGSASGVTVTVRPPYAAEVEQLRLEVCWPGTCVEDVVDLSPGSDTVDLGCSGPDPDDSCSATAIPNGTRVGFLAAPGLPAAPVQVRATATVAGREVDLGDALRPAAPMYPNGLQCDPGGNQLDLTVDREGIV